MTALHRITVAVLRHVPEPDRSRVLDDIEIIRRGLDHIGGLLSDGEVATAAAAVLEQQEEHPDGLSPALSTWPPPPPLDPEDP